MHNKTTIVITGAAGFIGSHLVEAFASNHLCTVIGIDNLDEYYIDQKRSNLLSLEHLQNFHFIQADILDDTAMYKTFETYHPSTVLHLAARPGVRSSFDTDSIHQSINVQGTKNIIALVEEFAVKKFIFASSSSVYGNRETSAVVHSFKESDPLSPISPYAVSKLKAEQIIIEALAHSPTSTTILRLFSVYGERMRPDLGLNIFSDAITQHRPLTKFGSGETRRDYTYIKDVVAGFTIALKDTRPGVDTFNVGSANPISLNTIIALLEKDLQQEANVVTQPVQRGESDYTYADITKLKAFGYAPSMSIEEGLRRFTTWYLRQHNQ